MRIAIDGRALTGRYTGDRTYWRNLMRVLPLLDPDTAYCVYSRLPVASDELPPFPNVSFQVVPASNDRAWTLSALPRALRQERADLLHTQYTIPPACPCPVVTTIHDISFRVYPRWFPTRDRLLLNLTIPFALRGAARVITDSDSSRADILRAYGTPGEKVIAIPLGLPPEFAAAAADEESAGIADEGPDVEAARRAAQENARELAKSRYNLDAPFVLAVGVLQPRKNLRLLARAFGQARAARGLPHLLALVGKAGWQTEEDALRQAARETGGEAAAQAIVFTGYVEDGDLPMLYRACEVFAYPSLHEGFGLPPLEAMACGAPTLVSDAPPMPQNVGEAALVIPARDADAWADTLGRALTDAELRAGLAARGPRQAARFTWEATARETLRVYGEALAASRAAK